VNPGSPSGYQEIARFYDVCTPLRQGELDLYREWALRGRREVLELGCGTGRILIPLARAGAWMWGLDSSPEMLARLRKALEAEPVSIRRRVVAQIGDMRDFALMRRFDSIFIPFNSFQHLLTPTDQCLCLETVRSHLRRGGRLVFDVAGGGEEPVAGQTRTPPRTILHPRDGSPCSAYQIIDHDPALPGARQTLIVEREGGEVVLRATVTVRYTTFAAIRDLLEATGLRVLDVWGGFRGEPLTPGGRQVWIAARP